MIVFSVPSSWEISVGPWIVALGVIGRGEGLGRDSIPGYTMYSCMIPPWAEWKGIIPSDSMTGEVRSSIDRC